MEAVLIAHPAIADAAVVARSDDRWGHVPVAAIVLRVASADPGDEALQRHCRASLAAFKVPVDFVRLASLPRTAGGKLRHAELRERIAQGPSESPPAEAPPMERAHDRSRAIERPDGVRISWHETGEGKLPILLLHGTLSNGRQLTPLAAELARAGDTRVLAVDRRGSGASRLPDPAPIDIGVHVEDLVAVLDREAIGTVALVGISYGAVQALELAARQPDRVIAVVAWEPPYGPLASLADAARMFEIGVATETAHRAHGPAAAAEVFLRGVAGHAAWERLSPRARAFIEGEGDGALADAALAGLDPEGLARIAAPVTLITGDASEPFYAPIADALVARVPGARRIRLPGLGHAGPILDPSTVAATVREALVQAGALSGAPALGAHPAAAVR
ncbi:MAG: O-succinylbenzoic acid--CoA ligase [Chloroflexi bacterium]|nr:O-succinylbenzoic acid--CoA ligase [Chloroflexota bacterium]